MHVKMWFRYKSLQHATDWFLFHFHFVNIEKWREDGRRKDADLIQARNLKAAVERRSIEIAQTCDSTKTTLETSNRESARLPVQHNECCQSLASTQENVKRLNSGEVASIAVA